MNTQVYKNAFGWIAETTVQVTDKMQVSVSTMKRSDGRIITIAREQLLGPANLYYYTMNTWAVRMKISDARATQKAITAQHQAALLELDTVIAQAKFTEAA